LVDAAAIHGDLRHLLVGDDVAELTSIGLYADFVGFYGYRLTGPNQWAPGNPTRTIADLQDNALLLGVLNPVASTLML